MTIFTYIVRRTLIEGIQNVIVIRCTCVPVTVIIISFLIYINCSHNHLFLLKDILGKHRLTAQPGLIIRVSEERKLKEILSMLNLLFKRGLWNALKILSRQSCGCAKINKSHLSFTALIMQHFRYACSKADFNTNHRPFWITA